MIEKLQTSLAKEINAYSMIQNHVVAGIIIDKINELVDAVNGILDYAPLEMAMKAEPEPADPYAEQRKWIGKLCRCWDSDINDDIWGILQDIKDNKTEKYYLYGIGYEYCEPVKPDDDIIYKGGNNE